MRIFLLLLAAWGVAGSAWAAPLRVVSFNVENGLGPSGSPGFEAKARLLERVGADVVALQELENDANSLDQQSLTQLRLRLGLLYEYSFPTSFHYVAILSRYPFINQIFVNGAGMARRIPLVQIDVPNTVVDPWIAALHLKAFDGDSNQFRRAVELTRLKDALISSGAAASGMPIVLLGDFNLVSTTFKSFPFDPDGSLNGNVNDLPFPIDAFVDADEYFQNFYPPISKLDLRSIDGSTYTYPDTSGALDHIMVSAPFQAFVAGSEIYDPVKETTYPSSPPRWPRPKFGDPATATFSYADYPSDHLPVFVDLILKGIGDEFPDDVVVPALGWNVSSNTLTFVDRAVPSGVADVTATDDQDPAPVVTVYPLNPTYTNAGTKKITYMARDRMGNIRTVDRTVTVAAWGQGGITHNLHWPPRMNLPPQGSENVYARLQIPGLTEGAAVAANVQAWIGFHGQNTDPTTWPESAWKVASLNPAALGAADEYWAQASSSELGIGTHYFSSRWSIDSGAYGYGGISADAVGGAWGATNGNGVLTVRASAIDWANLQWPPSGQIPLGGSFTIYARVYRAGVTPNAGAPGGNFRAQIGVSLSDENPEGSPAFVWQDAVYGTQYGNDDEFQRTVTGLAAGAYFYASRFSDDGGATWTYGGIASDGNGTGIWDGLTYASGILTVGSTVGTWSGNAPVTSELVGKYAIGGAANLSAASESPVMEAQSNSLSLTAIVRKDDPNLTVGAEWATDLGAAWSGEGVSSATNGLVQPADPGLERRKFTVPYDPANEPRKFLRLKATLAQ